MTLQQLACFRATARHGSFNAAARAMLLTQPAVSDQVRRLERELGVALVQRTGRGLELTNDGRTFLVHAERVLGEVADASASVGSKYPRAKRTVTFSMTRNALYYPVDQFVAAFVAQHPDVRLRLPGDNSSAVAEAVRSGSAEAGLVILPIDPLGLEVTTLFRDEILVVSARPSRVPCPATIEALAAEPLILYDAHRGFDDPTRRQLAARAQSADVTLEAFYDVEHVDMAVDLAARGLGNTIAARAMTRQAWFPERLRCTGFEEPLFDHFALVSRAGAPLSAELRTLVDAVRVWGSHWAPS